MKKLFATSTMSRASVVLGLSALGLLACGCSSGSKLVPATGEITLDGQPIAGATVTFMPQQAGRPATGTTDEQGRFTLSTAPEGEGAAVGQYAVVVLLTRYTNLPAAGAGGSEDTTGGSGIRPPDVEVVVPVRYNNAATSGLTATVAEGEENHFPFSLTSQP